MAIQAPHLSPRLIAKPLDEIRAWRLPEGEDLLALHRGVLKMLVATESLLRLELPQEIAAPDFDDPAEVAEWGVLAALLKQAEAAVAGPAHRARIARLRQNSPGHAMQLERLRRSAARKLRNLRMRVDFVRGVEGGHPPAPPPRDARRGVPLQ